MPKRPKKKIRAARSQNTVRPEVLAHFRRSVKKNRKLLELLTKG